MPATFDVERFEHVAATADTALLRLSGRWRAEQRERLSPPMLVVDDGRRTHRLAALPGPEDAAPLAGPDSPGWRAAFSAPAALIEGGGTASARARPAPRPGSPGDAGRPSPSTPAAAPSSTSPTPSPAAASAARHRSRRPPR